MDTIDQSLPPARRNLYLTFGLIMMALWAWSLEGPIRLWNYKYDDGLSWVAAIYATPFCFIPGVVLLTAAWRNRMRMYGAGAAFNVACCVSMIVVGFLIFQRIMNGPEG
ncbi:MAG: hypothetical protein U1E19_11070 [Rhodoblastus sp.]